MSDGTHIEWTDATWNLINGCEKVSPGCRGCYAIRDSWRLAHNPNRDVAASRKGLVRKRGGKLNWTGQIKFNKAVALSPLGWRKPRRIFVCASGDLFHKDVSDPWIDYVFMMALMCPQHTFQILTKRPERMREYMTIVDLESDEQTAGRIAAAMYHAGLHELPSAKRPNVHWPPRNVWLGTSVENQEAANERIPALLSTPAAVRWISAEPLLGPVDFTKIDTMRFRGAELVNALSGDALDFLGHPVGRMKAEIDWIVAGGESGSGARPMHPDWARSLRDQCERYSVPFLLKQWGEWSPGGPSSNGRPPRENLKRGLISMLDDGAYDGLGFFGNMPNVTSMSRIGKRLAGRTLDGVEHAEYPVAP